VLTLAINLLVYKVWPVILRKALFLHKRVIYEFLYHHYELEKKVFSTRDCMQVIICIR
jgi:hypothetical protein